MLEFVLKIISNKLMYIKFPLEMIDCPEKLCQHAIFFLDNVQDYFECLERIKVLITVILQCSHRDNVFLFKKLKVLPKRSGYGWRPCRDSSPPHEKFPSELRYTLHSS